MKIKNRTMTIRTVIIENEQPFKEIYVNKGLMNNDVEIVIREIRKRGKPKNTYIYLTEKDAIQFSKLLIPPSDVDPNLVIKSD
jgi:F0F1-type ATP synthase alpha subunit